jgi:hypothetical protein
MNENRQASAGERLLAGLALSPDVFPQRLDIAGGRTLLIRLDHSAYRHASFLDDRVLGPGTLAGWASNEQLQLSVRQLPAAAHPLNFIFHTGHVGSTLLSRLLDEIDSTLPLREPLPLRTLAEAHDQLAAPDSLLSADQFERLGSLYLRLWNRGYPTTRHCIIKATSSAGRLAPWILGHSAAPRAVYLSLTAEPYLATLLGGQNSSVDLRGHGPGRYRRLLAQGAKLPGPLHAMSGGEMAALAWLAESATRHATAARFAIQVLPLDFDELLQDIPQSISRVLGHFAISCEPAVIAAMAQSTTLSRYSKAPDFAYTPATRAAILQESRRNNAAEIRAGLRWIDAVAGSQPQLAAAAAASGV